MSNIIEHHIPFVEKYRPKKLEDLILPEYMHYKIMNFIKLKKIPNIIITGPPGAGKGTMSRYIEEQYKIPIISTGEILRQEIKNGTELGKLVKSLMEKGNLVPDNLVKTL